nr:uncharacterized protein LOC124814089 [Hydra vulgaris]
MELKRFVIVVQEDKNTNLKSAYDFLNYVYKEETYPNLVIALRIILTSPVTVASAERSFSKLKLIKTFHRSTMVDERLSSLAMLSIENEVARKLSYEGLINKFARSKESVLQEDRFIKSEKESLGMILLEVCGSPVEVNCLIERAMIDGKIKR